jgi:endo-1,4-beta-xylanase
LQWVFVEPQQGVFNYTEGEIVTSLAKEHGYTLRCHNLVWHSQLPDWVTATNWTADQLKDIIVNHIMHVAGHWKGQCYAWDVVNEALNEDGTYRDSVFYKVLGEEYIKLAFETAAKVDPHARLYYNDYNIESPGPKATGAQNIVKMLKKAGLRIDGVGLQGHFVAESHPTIDQHIDALKGFTDLGVEAAYTELDVRLTVPATPENLALQTEAYKNVSMRYSVASMNLS